MQGTKKKTIKNRIADKNWELIKMVNVINPLYISHKVLLKTLKLILKCYHTIQYYTINFVFV